MKRININRTIILGILLLVAVVANAQQSAIVAADEFYQKKDFANAKTNIDAAIANPETSNDAQAWQLRGYIYKAMYTKNERSNKRSPIRLEAFNSFKKSLSLDVNKELFTDNIKGVKFLLSTLFNDAAESLDPVDYKVAIELFEKYKEFYKIVDPSPEAILQKEIEFNVALASVYNTIIETDSRGSAKFVTLAKNIFLKILAVEPDNISANIGMAKLYYNQAVYLIKIQELDLDIVTLDGVLDNQVKLLREARPFMEKAYELDPARPDAIEGLTGIYTGLNDEEKSRIFREKLEKIKKPK